MIKAIAYDLDGMVLLENPRFSQYNEQKYNLPKGSFFFDKKLMPITG